MTLGAMLYVYVIYRIMNGFRDRILERFDRLDNRINRLDTKLSTKIYANTAAIYQVKERLVALEVRRELETT